MSTSRGLLATMIVAGAGYAANGALTGSVGAKVLETAGYAGYSVLEAARMGAAGGAVLGAGVGAGAVLGARAGLFSEEQESNQGLLANIAVSTFVSTVSGVLGHAMLNSIVEMPLEKVAAAMATGTGAVLGGAIAVAVVVGGCVLCLAFSNNSYSADESDDNAYRRMRGAPGGIELV